MNHRREIGGLGQLGNIALDEPSVDFIHHVLTLQENHERIGKNISQFKQKLFKNQSKQRTFLNFD